MEIILLTSILFQLTAGVLSIHLIRISGSYKAWILMILVVFLMMIRRLITLYKVTTKQIDPTSIYEAEVTALIISFVLSAALFLMLPIFRNFRNSELNHIKRNRDLAKAKRRAEDGDAIKTSFLQNLSHEIRTPMNGILGFSDLLLSMDIQNQKHKNYLKIIKNNGEQLLAIVTDLQTISNINSGKINIYHEQISPIDIINHLHSTFLPQAENAGIQLRTRFDKKKIHITTDRTKLTQILTNLLSNALKFTEAGYVVVGFQQAGQTITFFVRDTGIGISKEQQKQIFDRFVQADNSIQQKYGGTGLGLSISKGLVELLGGDIRVKSVPGKGTEFSFSLPIHPTG